MMIQGALTTSRVLYAQGRNVTCSWYQAGSQFHSAQTERMAVMLLLQSSRAVTARLKRESGRDLSGCQVGSALAPVLQPRDGKLGHQAPAIQRRDVGMSCTGEGFGFPAVWFSDLLGSRRRVRKS